MVDTSTEAVTKLLDGVTPGPWKVDEWDSHCDVVADYGVFGEGFVICEYAYQDARFIAAARDLVPALLAERDALKKERDEAIEGWHVIHPNITLHDTAKVPEVQALIDAAKALHIDMLERAECRMDTIRGEQYRIVNSGRTAWANFDAALRAITEGRA